MDRRRCGRLGRHRLDSALDLNGPGSAATSASASATSALASAGLRSVIAATVRRGRGLVHVLGQQVAHDGVARSAAVATHHDADQMSVAAAYRGDQVEARGAGVAGLDAIDALDAAEQVVMVADGLAVVVEGLGREVAVIARKAVLDRAAEDRLVARGGDLLVIGQAGGVDIDRAGSCRGRAPCASSSWQKSSSSPPIASAITTAASLAERVTMPLMASSTRMRLTGTQAEFGGRLLGGVLGHRHLGIERHLAALEPLEQQIERHDLGQRGRVTRRVGIAGGQAWRLNWRRR